MNRIVRFAPLWIIFTRFVLALLVQALVAGLFLAQGHPTPWQAAAPWWTVYGTLIDLGSLLCLTWLIRQEGIRLVDLFGFERSALGWDFALAVGLTVLYLVLGGVGGAVLTQIFYGTPQPPVTFMGGLPPGATLHSLLIWPVIWGITEELTYQGYALPRLQRLLGQTTGAILIVGLGFGLQHITLPLLWDGRFLLWRLLPSLVIGLVAAFFYLRIRRLLPFIIAHWALNFLSVLSLMLT